MTATGSPEFWQTFYEPGARPGWDMRAPTPVLPELLELAALQPGAAMAVPGCGFGHDAAELARLGFRTTGLDFAERALQRARERYGDQVDWRQEDWFAPAAAGFDAIFDHTCFVAMDPGDRPRYVEACARHLHPGGLWLGVFFHTVTTGDGPPFPVGPEELRSLAEPLFEILHLGPAQRSHPKRAGREFLLVGRKR